MGCVCVCVCVCVLLVLFLWRSLINIVKSSLHTAPQRKYPNFHSLSLPSLNLIPFLYQMYECLPARSQMGQRFSNINDPFKADNSIRIQIPIFWLIVWFFLPFLLPTHLPILNPSKCYAHLIPEIRGPLWQECSSPWGHNYPLTLDVDLGFLFILAAESISVRAQPAQFAATPEAHHAVSWALSPVSPLWHLPLLCLPVSRALFLHFFSCWCSTCLVSQLSHIVSIKTTHTA